MPFTLTKDVLRRAQAPAAQAAATTAPEQPALPRTDWPATVEPSAFSTSATSILSADVSFISSCIALMPSVDGRGRGLYCTRERGYQAGELLFMEPAFAWSIQPLEARSDRDLLQRTVASSCVSLGGVLSRFLCLYPNDVYLLPRSASPRASSSSTGQQWVSDIPSGTGVTLSTQALVCPAIHKNGFQTRLPDHGAAVPSASSPRPEQDVQLMCLIASLTNHSCQPNIAYEPVWISESVPSATACSSLPSYVTAHPEERWVPGLAFRALRTIQQGEELCHAYVDPSAEVEDRRCRLQEGYGFVCVCHKCEAEGQQRR